MRILTAVAVAAILTGALLVCTADGSDAVATVTFHYENGSALYRQTPTGEPLNTVGIENTIALGPWYDRDGHQWDPAEPITGDLELWLTISGPEPDPPEPEPIPEAPARGPGTAVYIVAGLTVAGAIGTAMVLWMRKD